MDPSNHPYPRPDSIFTSNQAPPPSMYNSPSSPPPSLYPPPTSSAPPSLYPPTNSPPPQYQPQTTAAPPTSMYQPQAAYNPSYPTAGGVMYSPGAGPAYNTGSVMYSNGSVAAYPSAYPPQLMYAAPPPGSPANVVYVVAAPPPISPVPVVTSAPNRDIYSMSMACIICYLVGFCVWVVYLPSIIISLQMVSKKHIPEGKRTAVVVFSVLELLAWLFVPCFIWYSTEQCYYDLYDDYCTVYWWGWISLVTFYVFALCFGIPRVLFTYRAVETGYANRTAVVATVQQNMVVVG